MKKNYFVSLGSDLKASITVFFVALPLCLGIALSSNAPLFSGLVAGIIGGILITLISKSELSVSGPAAGLTAICASAITDLGSVEIFFLSVCIAGLLQVLLGLLRLGGFTHFIPSSVIKGMLTAIGIILVTKQIPTLLGYNKPDFWANELFNILTFNSVYTNVKSLLDHISPGVITVSVISIGCLLIWEKFLKTSFIPTAFIVVIIGVFISLALKNTSYALEKSQFVSVAGNTISQIKFPDWSYLFTDTKIWTTAILICFVASLETLLSVTAIDKLDPYNRVTPQNRELIAQGTGNFLSGLFGGLPVTAVIVRSAANAQAGARTRLSSFLHGVWLLLAVSLAASLLNAIPYCVLAVILIRTGYNLANPKLVKSIYKQGREQFLPFIITVVAILFTDLLIGVVIGFCFSIYYLIKHTFRAGFTLTQKENHYIIELALNVSFLNKKKFVETLDSIPGNSIVDISGSKSVYIDHDVLEIFQDFKAKAKNRNIILVLHNIPEVETIEIH